jgi:hypothetical protein
MDDINMYVILFNSVPELYQRSAKDICLDVDNVLCVVFLTGGKPNK